MSEESTTPDLVERTRSLWKAASQRDFEALMSFFASDAVWETTLDILDGAAAIRERLEGWFGAFDELELEPEEIFDLGNGVTLAVVNWSARPAGSSSSGGYMQRREALIGVWHEGMVTRATTFLDIDAARAAAERLAAERGRRG
jgi:ketosteroid isomerase-like protein